MDIMNTAPEISVLIVTYNSVESIIATLDSVLQSGYGPALEILVWDNASTDGSLSRVRMSCHQPITTHESKENIGFARAVNALSRLAIGAHLLILNPDCVIGDDCLKVMHAYLEANPKLGAVGPVLVNSNGKNLAGGGWQPSNLRLLSEIANLPRSGRRLSRSGLYARRKFTADKSGMYPVSWVAGTCLLTRRKDFTSVGGFAEDFFMYCEDMDLGRKFESEGLQSALAVSVRAVHIGGASHASVRSAFRLQRESLWRYFRKYLSRGCLLNEALFRLLLRVYFLERQLFAHAVSTHTENSRSGS
jgi:N-acetylglucosaminyl-diphospho-decaprenol L-rhamnosyltransferase